MKIDEYTIEGIKHWDCPDYCDAFLATATDENGKDLTPEECLEWQDNNPDEFRELLEKQLQ